MKRCKIALVVLTVLALVLPACAHAATPTELSVSIGAHPAVLSSAGSVDLTVTVTLETGVVNDAITVLSVSCGGVSSPQPQAVYYAQSVEFVLEGVPIAQSQIGQTVPVELLYINLDGELKSEQHYFTVSQPTSIVSLFRLADPVAPRSGETVKVRYVVSNSGEDAVTDVHIVDDALGEIARLSELDGGQQQSIEISFTMPDQDLISKGSVQYISAAGEPLTYSYDEFQILRRQFALSVRAQASAEQVEYGQPFWLGCTVINSGVETYTDVTLNSDYLESLPKIGQIGPGETYYWGQWVLPAATRDYEVEITGKDPDGEEYAVSAVPVRVEVARAPELDDRVMNLTTGNVARNVDLKVQTDQSQLDSQGRVSFEVTVTHPGLALSDVVIRENTLGEMERAQLLPSGDQLFKYSIPVQQSGEYQFSLSAKDENGVAVLALADPVQVEAPSSVLQNGGELGPYIPASLSAVPQTPARPLAETMVFFAIAALMVFSIATLAVLIVREWTVKRRHGPR